MISFKTKAPYSIRNVFLKYFLTMFFCISSILIFYCIMFVKINLGQMSYNANSAMNFIISSLQTEMNDISYFIHKVCYNDNSFQMLTVKNLKDSDRVVYQYNVIEMLKRHVSPYECVFVFSEDQSIAIYAAGSSFSPNGSQYIYQLKDTVRDYWLEQDSSQYNTWISFQDEHHSVLMKTLKVNDTYVCATIDLNSFNPVEYTTSDYSSTSYYFYDDEKILSDIDNIDQLGISLKNNQFKPKFFSNYYATFSEIENTDINIGCIFVSNYSWIFTNISVIIFILIAIIACAIIIYFYYLANNILLYPIDQINAATKHLKENDSESFSFNKNSNIIEYQNINNALANLIDQKIILDNEKQLEAFEKDHARLQYYYSQTRSHFFLNCLKSLYNMSEYGDHERMQRMIISFSNHLRYVFHDNLKFVSLEAELKEVNDYYNIILLDLEAPIVINTQVDEALYKYQVPSLLIQTFLENTAKYNRHPNNLIIFNIKISLSELKGVPVLQIHLSDNGVGYSDQILELLNGFEKDLFAKKNVGISNLKYRIELMYKSNYQLAFYNAPSGGACALIYLPLLENNENKDK